MLGMTRDVYAQAALNRDCGLDSSEVLPERSLSKGARVVSQDDGTQAQLDQLVRTIESEIIPRLMLAHRADADPDTAAELPEEIPDQEDVLEFAKIIRTQDAAVALRKIEDMRDRGYLLETLYLHLLAPAARHLGELWEADLCDFIEVTVALGRIQQVLRELSPAFRDESETRLKDLRILLAPAPGDQHTLGLLMVKEFFLRSGWNVWAGAITSNKVVPDMVRSEWFDAVGLSVGSECKLDNLQSWICSIRAASCNPAIVILVGGPIFVLQPDYASAVGADATASDAQQALYQAESLVALKV